MSKLFTLLWWKDAARRGLYTALAVALPYLGAALIADVPWVTVALTAALAFVASLATSLAGLPETVGVDLPWWLAAVERTVKTFAQALAAGFIGATLITDVPWSEVIQAAALAALVSLVRLILATLPQDPTAGTLPMTAHEGGTYVFNGPSSAEEIADALDAAARRRERASTTEIFPDDEQRTSSDTTH